MVKYVATTGALVGIFLAAPPGFMAPRAALSAQSTLTDTCTVSEDTRLEQKSPGSTYAPATTLYAAGNVNGVGHMAEAALKFSCSGIPTSATILTATLKINVSAASGDTYHVFELLRPWTETGASWNNYVSNQAWAVAGARGTADRGTASLGSFTATTTGQTSIPLNAAGKALLTGWISGGSNNGILIRPPLTADDIGFSSDDTPNGTQLIVVTSAGAIHTLPLLGDTRLEEKAPATKYGTSTTLYGAGNVNSVGQMAAAALRFNLSGISPGTALASVTLQINVTGSTGDRYDLYELKQNWTESDATWTEYAAGALWEQPGAKGPADRGTTVLGTFTGASAGLTPITLDQAGVALVSAWINNTKPNNGLLLRPTLSNDDVGFSSSETTTPPVIEVTYQLSGPPPSELVVMTYNTKHDRNIEGVMNAIAAQDPRPDVVVLQETKQSNVDNFIAGLNERYQVDTFAGRHTRACHTATGETCTTWESEGVAVLTRHPICESEQFWFKHADEWHDWRPAARVQFSLPDGTAVQAYSIHLAVLQSSRLAAIADLKSWTSQHSSPRLIGGDFNAIPTDDEIDHPTMGMLTDYHDAWTVGSGSGYTHNNDNTNGPTKRIDYWFSDNGGPASPVTAKTVTSNASDHRAVVVKYSIPSGSSCTPPQ